MVVLKNSVHNARYVRGIFDKKENMQVLMEIEQRSCSSESDPTDPK